MAATTVASTPDGPEVVWEAVACPLCGAVDEEVLLETAGGAGADIYRLVRCRSCGLGYLNPRPDPDSIGRFYADEYMCYQPQTQPPLGWWGRSRRYLDRLVLSRRYGYPPPLRRWYEKALATVLGSWLGWGRHSQTALPFRGQGEMLDFGCGAGWFAHRMQEQGWKVTGVDFSAHAAELAHRHYNLKVLVGTLPHADIVPESFDLITMGAVLEHVHWPHEVIGAAARALRPGGSLVISVPNLASWGFRHFGADWWPLELPRHLLHFSPATLRRLVETHGLEVCEERMVARASWMRFSFASTRQGQARRGLLTWLSRLRLIPSLATRLTVWSKQADCILIHARRPEAATARPDHSANRAA